MLFNLFESRRNRVAQAARDKWPGNNIPTFKNDKAALKCLSDLVEQLLPECQPQMDKMAIRKHIIDTCNERRRQIRKGYDYENVSCYVVI